jgi:hypothetical protein
MARVAADLRQSPSSQTAGSVLVAAIGAYGTIAAALQNTQR